MKITKIERQKKNRKRANVFLDGEFALGLHTDTLLQFGLRAADSISRERLVEIKHAEEEHRAMQTALRFLHYRLRTIKEIRSKLSGQEFSPGIIDKTIVRLSNSGLVDDRRFAEALIHDLSLGNPAGERLLRQRLKLKGVPKAIIDDALTELVTPEQQLRTALDAARRYVRRLSSRKSKAERPVQMRKVATHLERRGFDWDTIKAVLRTLFNEDFPTD